MRAVVTRGGQLEIVESDDPTPGPGEILVAVRAAGLNRADLLMAKGRYVVGQSVRAPAGGAVPPPAHQAIPLGGEVAGEVVARGAGVTSFAPGDRVMAMCRGGYATHAVVDAARAMAVPANLSWAEAGAFPITFITAHDALFTAGGLQPGQSVLVNAASSGVGVAALQLARLGGATPLLASSTNPAKLDALAAAGIEIDLGLVAGGPAFVEQALEATGGRGVDVVADSVGGPAWAESLASAALGARIVSIGRLGGNDATVNLDEVARKRVSLIGVTFRTRNADQARAVIAAAAADLLPALAAGRLRVLVDRTFPLEEAAEAQRYLRANQHLGKIVLLNS